MQYRKAMVEDDDNDADKRRFEESSNSEASHAKSESYNSLNSLSSNSEDDWQEPQKVSKIIAKQKRREKQNLFNPYSYFGALDMPEIPPEDEPAHELIRRVFNNPLTKKK